MQLDENLFVGKDLMRIMRPDVDRLSVSSLTFYLICSRCQKYEPIVADIFCGRVSGDMSLGDDQFTRDKHYAVCSDATTSFFFVFLEERNRGECKGEKPHINEFHFICVLTG